MISKLLEPWGPLFMDLKILNYSWKAKKTRTYFPNILFLEFWKLAISKLWKSGISNPYTFLKLFGGLENLGTFKLFKSWERFLQTYCFCKSHFGGFQRFSKMLEKDEGPKNAEGWGPLAGTLQGKPLCPVRCVGTQGTQEPIWAIRDPSATTCLRIPSKGRCPWDCAPRAPCSVAANRKSSFLAN